MKLDERSERNLNGVHPDLIRAIRAAADAIQDDAPAKFIITEGLRTAERQKVLVAEGKSKTMNSRHLTGHAVDIAIILDGKLTWNYAEYEAMSKIILREAVKQSVPIMWGGHFKGFKDGPHYELNRKLYP